jgi:hypothetical protein
MLFVGFQNVRGWRGTKRCSHNQEKNQLHACGWLKTMEAILIPSSQQHHSRYVHDRCPLFSVAILNSLDSIHDGMYQHPNCIHFSLKPM